MGIPLPVPGTPLPASDSQIAQAEQLLSAILQVIARGSTGSALNTPASYVQVEANQPPVPNVIDKQDYQLFLRQLSVALTTWLSFPLPPPSPSPVYSFSGTCLSSAQLGDLVYMTGGPSNEVRAIDLEDFYKMPAIGCIISKPTPTTCDVQTSNIVSGIYSGLTPGRIHFAGIGANPKPVYPAPIPAFGQTMYMQPIGIAISNNVLALAPGLLLTKVKG